VAASANLPVVLLTLYWKRCNTAGVVAGVIIGTLTAIALVLVSPNMTYPLTVKAAQQKIIELNTAKIEKLNAELASATDAAAKEKIASELAAAEKTKKAAEDTIRDLGTATTSLVGLEKPLYPLKNPGLVSIPLGFLAVILFSLFYRDQRAEAIWDELYVRSNTGIGRQRIRALALRAPSAIRSCSILAEATSIQISLRAL
jgi:cation/acetate symporter